MRTGKRGQGLSDSLAHRDIDALQPDPSFLVRLRRPQKLPNAPSPVKTLVEAIEQGVDILVIHQRMVFKLVPSKEQRQELEIPVMEFHVCLAIDVFWIEGHETMLLPIVEVFVWQAAWHRGCLAGHFGPQTFVCGGHPRRGQTFGRALLPP